MVYDELDLLQRLQHPHIVRFVDWFESRVSSGPTWFRRGSSREIWWC